MSEEIKNSESVEAASTPKKEETKTEAAPAPAAAASPAGENSRPESSRPSGGRPDRPDRGQRGQRVPRFRKKVCKFCHNKDVTIDYKKPEILERFITDRGKILPRRITGTCAKHQRRVAAEIKKARIIALLPFVEL